MEIELPSMSDVSDKRFKEHMALLESVRNKAALKSQKADEQAILLARQPLARQALKEPPSVYKAGDNVLVQFQSKKWNKVKGKGVTVIPSYLGQVVDSNLKTNKYMQGESRSRWK